MIRRALPLLAAGLVLVGCGAAPDVPAAAAAPVITTGPTVGVPVSISIPTLKVTDDVVPVGLASDGEMDVPPVQSSGWYRLAAKPGERGAAVIVGHVNFDGVPGALGRIGELRPADQVTVTDDAGVAHTFSVYSVVEVPKTDYAKTTVPLVFGPRTASDLELVTCSGTVHDHEYANNTIVSSRIVS